MNIAWFNANAVEWSGYGHIGAKLREGVMKRGFTLVPNTSWEWDAMVICSPPNAFMLGPGPRPEVILHTMFEAEPLPPAWVALMNRVGLIWAPSTYCEDLFRRHGVTTPIVVGGYGVDQHIFTPVNRRGRTGTFKVRLWADNFISRKNVLRTIKVFMEAELPDAELEVKLNDQLFSTGTLVGEDMQPLSNVKIITMPFTRPQLVEWLQEGDAMLYLSGGEGYGLIPLEAMSTGLTTICAYNTGMADYLTSDSALLVYPKGRMPAPSLINNYDMPEITTVEPDWDAAVSRLRWAYLNRDHAYRIGEWGSERAAQLPWESAWDRAETIIETFVRERQAGYTVVR